MPEMWRGIGKSGHPQAARIFRAPHFPEMRVPKKGGKEDETIKWEKVRYHELPFFSPQGKPRVHFVTPHGFSKKRMTVERKWQKKRKFPNLEFK